MDVYTIISINEKYKKILIELDNIIMSINNEINKNESMIKYKKTRKVFFNSSGYFICFSIINKPYMIIHLIP